MALAYLALGSNVGDREGYLQNALAYLKKNKIKIIQSSSVYETEPFGFKEQPWFLNMVIAIETQEQPSGLLTITQRAEKNAGRQRIFKWGPRTLDIDILFYNNEIIKTKNLTIPHPSLHERNFVLKPLLDIAPDFYHPVFKKPLQKLLEECSDTTTIIKT